MRRFLKVVLVLGIGLVLGGTVLAAGGPPGGHHGGGHATGGHSSHHGGYHASGAHHGYHPSGSHGGYHAGHHGSYHGHYKDYHLRYGHQFRHGYYYRGRNHPHWSTTRWDARYGCTLYYDPYVRCYYYWCEPDGCYYPVSYTPYNRYAGSPARGAELATGDNAPPPPAPMVPRQ
jgi:hypothetical protein